MGTGRNTVRGGQRGPSTRESLADALVGLLSQGEALDTLRVKQITDACGIDRQTFYYYFKSIPQLAQYAYERELERAFGQAGARETGRQGWKESASETLNWLAENPALKEMIVPALGDKGLREELLELVNRELEQEFLPKLSAAGMEEDSARERCRYIAHMLESALMSWLNGDIVAEPTHVLDCIEEMLEDYLAGLELRLSRQA
ncbi:MAG: TetR/AcrR family transcriptional regulator [Coriobacteriales bacterium]